MYICTLQINNISHGLAHISLQFSDSNSGCKLYKHISLSNCKVLHELAYSQIYINQQHFKYKNTYL